MTNIIRFGVSLPADLLKKFDSLCQEKGYNNRSEAIRDLIRDSLVQGERENESQDMAGALTLIYDHHQSSLAQKLTEIQHDALHSIIATLHVHLDHNNCMEVLVLRGAAKEIQNVAQRLIATKGVKHGQLSLTSSGKDLS